MSGRRWAWALACTCTSVASAVAGQGPVDPVALEAELARGRGLYLVVESERRVLSIRARGMELDAVQLREIRAVWQDAGGEPGPPSPPGEPQVWRITEAPKDEWRRVVAPEVLVPYVDDDEEQEQEEAMPDGSPVAPSPTPPPPRPDRYSVATDSPWRIAVAPSVDAVAPLGWWRRVVRGWRKLVGAAAPPFSPTLVLVVDDAEDARRVVHLFRPEMPVLVGGEPAVDRAPGS
jgi:hypothetical protein